MLDNKVIEQYTKDWHNWSNNKRKIHGYPMRRKFCNFKIDFNQLFSKREIYESIKKCKTSNFFIDKLYEENYKPIILPELERDNFIIIPTCSKPIKMIFVGDKDANLWIW